MPVTQRANTSIKTLTTDTGTYQLTRYPLNSPDTLQAWDAADKQLIAEANRFLGEDLQKSSPVVWILNDAFGAITTALHQYQPLSFSDSFSAHQACRENHKLNQLTITESQLLSSLALSEKASLRQPDLVLFKMPKSIAYWDYQLCALKPHLSEECHILGGAMVKHLTKSMIEKTQTILGSAQPSLASQKARLISCKANLTGEQPALKSMLKTYQVPEYDLTLDNHPNLFSRDRLDIGSRFLLENFPIVESAKTIIDMACGNGVLGIQAGRQNPDASIVFTDESYMAIASAKHNAERYLVAEQATFELTDSVNSIANEDADLIINNPPFHQQHVVGDFIARRMFKDARRVLKKQGELWVVANRQLGYHVVLKKLFGNCETVKGNAKFVILKAIKH